MTIDEKVLQDVLKNTSLNEDEINYQFNSILISFENEETPYNQLYIYLKEHYSNYLNILYNIKIPSYKRPKPVKALHTEQDFNNLLATDVLVNSTIYGSEIYPSKEHQDNIITSVDGDSTTKVPEVSSTPQELNSNSTEQHTSFGIGSDTIIDTTPSSTVTSDFSTSVSSPAYDTSPSSFD